VKANCARAKTTASKPSNIGAIRRRLIQRGRYHAMSGRDIAPERHQPPQTQSDPEGGIPSGSLEVLGG
jgi:hypothetical protein